MPSAGHKKQSVEFAEQIFRSTFFVYQMFASGFRNLSANAVPMEALKQLLFIATDIQFVNDNLVAC